MQFPPNTLLSMTSAFIALSCMQLSSGRVLPKIEKSTQVDALLSVIKSKSQTNQFHIARRSDILPFKLDTLHMPCDTDAIKLELLMPSFPNHCIWLYNNRYVDENFYRNFKLTQLEAFFFGQYYERFRRYEMDPHNF